MSQAQIIDGKAIAARWRERIAEDVAHLAGGGMQPGLAVVLVGADPASQVYVRNKGEQTAAVGMKSVTHTLDEATPQNELLALIATLNADPTLHGILVQLPLPRHLDSAVILEALDPAKDVDGLTVSNAGRLASGLKGMVPCTPNGCMVLLRSALGHDLTGKRAVVVGRSNLMGKPMAQLLLQADCTVTIAHSRTQELAARCREADILVAAVGRPEMVKGDWIKPGAAVIDVGINRVPARDATAAAAGKTRLVGDVAFDEAKTVAGFVTPVPGGVGPMTIAGLLYNTLVSCRRANGLDDGPVLGGL